MSDNLIECPKCGMKFSEKEIFVDENWRPHCPNCYRTLYIEDLKKGDEVK
jgi:transposase-like protein